jgi:hypothetical protein
MSSKNIYFEEKLARSHNSVFVKARKSAVDAVRVLV